MRVLLRHVDHQERKLVLPKRTQDAEVIQHPYPNHALAVNALKVKHVPEGHVNALQEYVLQGMFAEQIRAGMQVGAEVALLVKLVLQEGAQLHLH